MPVIQTFDQVPTSSRGACSGEGRLSSQADSLPRTSLQFGQRGIDRNGERHGSVGDRFVSHATEYFA